jgi:hypothetical protein
MLYRETQKYGCSMTGKYNRRGVMTFRSFGRETAAKRNNVTRSFHAIDVKRYLKRVT